MSGQLTTICKTKVAHVEGDSLLTILAINQGHLFSDWPCAPVIADCRQQLSFFSSWTASKVSRCANSRAHSVAKWAASHLVFGSIPENSPFLSALRIRSGKDPPL